jgi:hypothetical protein
MFEVGYRLRHSGLGHIEVDSSFSHAARVEHGHEYIELAQLEPTPDAIVPGHCNHPSRNYYGAIRKRY